MTGIALCCSHYYRNIDPIHEGEIGSDADVPSSDKSHSTREQNTDQSSTNLRMAARGLILIPV